VCVHMHICACVCGVCTRVRVRCKILNLLTNNEQAPNKETFKNSMAKLSLRSSFFDITTNRRVNNLD
jgi:hypothetical protein